MKTIALRFGEHFSPEIGTIPAHEEIINEYGFVWYGKLGASVSDKVIQEIMNSDNPHILLIRSGKAERYWAQVTEIQHQVPEEKYIPHYYRAKANTFKTWFKISDFTRAPKDVMNNCKVASSGATLSEASKHSMSPYFIIEVVS